MRHVNRAPKTRTSTTRIYSNSFGFSLIEIAVSVGILGVLALGTAGLIADTVKTRRSAEVNAEVLQVKKDFQNELKGYKKHGGTLPLHSGSGSCFNESSATTATGADINLTVNGRTLSKNSIYSVGNIRFEVRNLSFSNAIKVYEDGTKVTYFGVIKMGTKNLATNMINQDQLITSAMLSLSAGGCKRPIDVDDYVMLPSEAANCGVKENENYTTQQGGGNLEGRCAVSPGKIATNGSCSEGGFPVYVSQLDGSISLNCVKPLTTVCKENPGSLGANKRAIFNGINYVDSAAGGSVKVAEFLCADIGLPAQVRTFDPPVTLPTHTTSTSTVVYEPLAKSKCLEMVDAARVESKQFDCDAIRPSAGAKLTLLASETTLTNAPSVSQVKPISFTSIRCICSGLSILNGEFCGNYSDAGQGYNDVTTSSAVYKCIQGRLNLVKSGGLAVMASEPSLANERTGDFHKITNPDGGLNYFISSGP